MSDLSNLLLLLVLVAVVGLWLKLSAARERAILEARRQCAQHGLQLLDETVGLRGVRLRRINGLRMIERCYGFEVSIDGHDRQSGRLWMIGTALTSVSVPVSAAAQRDAIDVTTPAQLESRVVPLRPRGDNRLN